VGVKSEKYFRILSMNEDGMSMTPGFDQPHHSFLVFRIRAGVKMI
jgi:hypothetical protein